MNFEFVGKKSKCDTNLVFYSEEKWKKEKGKLKKIVGSDFEFKEGSYFAVHNEDGFKRTILMGLGDEKKITLETFRKASGKFASVAKALKIKKIQVDLSRGFKFSDDMIEKAVLEGIMLGQYTFYKYKKKEAKKDTNITKIFFSSKPTDKKKNQLKRSAKIIENVYLVRDMVNDTSYEMNSLGFEKIARKVAKNSKLKIKILDEKMIKKEKMGLILAVNRGSEYPPRMIIMQYNGGKKGDPVVALMGKGITFDTGGVNLKPSGYIENMRTDMAGAATVLGIMKSLAELGVKKNVIGFMTLTDNAIGEKSINPGDIFTSYDGTTVEIRNTDAEGRLILADTAAYAVKKYKPDFIFDFATLTGACLVALGEMAAAIVSNDDNMAGELQSFSHRSEIFERTWVLPAYDDAKEALKSKIADIKNLGFDKGYAGTITGGLFIGKFVGETPWIHIDIAGMASMSESKGYMPEGASGFGVRLLTEFIDDTKFKKFKKPKN